MRKWLRPRFSLRLLMLAVTAFAIGFGIAGHMRRCGSWTTLARELQLGSGNGAVDAQGTGRSDILPMVNCLS